MIDLFRAGGFFMWPISLSAVLVLALAAVAVGRMRGTEGGGATELRTGIDAVLFWGAVAAVLGALGTTGGLAQMGRAIERAGGASAALVWGGVQLTLVTAIFGLAVLLVALVLWYGLSFAARGKPHAAR